MAFNNHLSSAVLLLVLGLAGLSCCYGRAGAMAQELSDVTHSQRSLTQTCRWNCDKCTNCKLAADGVCRLFGSRNSTCRIVDDCMFGRQVYRANQILTPPGDWSCAPAGKTGVCKGCPASLAVSPKPPSSPPPSPPPSPQRSGGSACQWTCDTCTTCKPVPDGTCRLFGDKCHFLQDCLFGPLVFKAKETLAPGEWACAPPGKSSTCPCPAL